MICSIATYWMIVEIEYDSYNNEQYLCLPSTALSF